MVGPEFFVERRGKFGTTGGGDKTRPHTHTLPPHLNQRCWDAMKSVILSHKPDHELPEYM